MGVPGEPQCIQWLPWRVEERASLGKALQKTWLQLGTDLAKPEPGLDEIRHNPIKMHEVVHGCRNSKAENESRERAVLFAEEIWGYNGSHAASAVVLCEHRELHSTRTPSMWQPSPLCSALI